MAKVRYVDPPNGWKYGFPKAIPEKEIPRAMQWIVEQGYPQELIDECAGFFYWRWWEQEENVDEQRL